MKLRFSRMAFFLIISVSVYLFYNKYLIDFNESLHAQTKTSYKESELRKLLIFLKSEALKIKQQYAPSVTLCMQ